MEICHLFRNFSNGANYARDLLYFVNTYNKNPFILKNNILDQTKLPIIYSKKEGNYPGGSISTQCVILFTALRIEFLWKK